MQFSCIVENRLNLDYYVDLRKIIISSGYFPTFCNFWLIMLILFFWDLVLC
jgi:hypothetical protein